MLWPCSQATGHPETYMYQPEPQNPQLQTAHLFDDHHQNAPALP